MSSEHRLAGRKRIGRKDLEGESVLAIKEHHHFHREIQQLCDRLGAHVLRDYEGTSLDTLRQMVVMGMGIAFLPALYVRSEIHHQHELRVVNEYGEAIDRTHALVWRRTSPARQLFQEIANEIRGLMQKEFSGDVKVVAKGRSPSRTKG